MDAIRVLLVDDEAEFTATLAKVLGRRGFAVEVAGDGDLALARLAAGNGFDVVVLDVKLPGKDGLAVLAEIRQRRPEIEVILMTGHLSAGGEREGLSGGAFAYLLKPHPLPALIERIEEAAAHGRTRGAATAAGAAGGGCRRDD
jgi:CheY-like chemotaxis protein